MSGTPGNRHHPGSPGVNMSAETGPSRSPQAIFDALHRELSHRILILDGAMGTMIQRYKLTEEDFRGERLRDHPKDLKGNNDLLCLTRPDVIGEIHERVPRRRRRHHRDEHVQQHVGRAGRLRPRAARLRVEPRGRAARACRLRRVAGEDPDRPRFVAGSIGPTNRTLSISPDVNDPAFRAIDVRRAPAAYDEQVRGLVDGGATSCCSRRSSTR